MTAPYNTIYLDPTTWDLAIDVDGNIAMAQSPYALAQDAASAIKTFLGECWYDTTIGVPYWEQILGKRPTIPLLKQRITAAALTVPGVVSATTYISSVSGRTVSGQVQISDTSGTTSTASF
jgi:hypothetical protein